jgi:hypothetical protein
MKGLGDLLCAGNGMSGTIKLELASVSSRRLQELMAFT